MKCDELKAFWNTTGRGNSCLCYLKSDADKLLADLEESHKNEVGQLLIEIAELKAQKAQAEDDCAFWKNKYNDCKRELDLLKDTNAFYNGGK